MAWHPKIVVDRSAQTRQLHIKSPRIHLHTPPNPTCSRSYDHEWLKADYKPDSPPLRSFVSSFLPSILSSFIHSSRHLFNLNKLISNYFSAYYRSITNRKFTPTTIVAVTAVPRQITRTSSAVTVMSQSKESQIALGLRPEIIALLSICGAVVVTLVITVIVYLILQKKRRSRKGGGE